MSRNQKQRMATEMAAGMDARRPIAAAFRHQGLLLTVLVLVAFVPFLPALLNDFLPTWDDGSYVLQNYRVHHLNGANAIDVFRLHPQRGMMPNAQYTPLVELSFMLENHLFGLRPAVFHLDNVLLHVLNTLLVFAFVRRLTGWARMAGLTAALFAVHPLHVESVAWVAERKDLLSAFFYLLAVTLYLRHLDRPARRDYALALAAGVLAFLSKPLAVTLPAILLLCALYKGGGWKWKTFKPLVPFVALAALGIGITLYTHFTTTIVRGEEVRALGANLLVAARGIAHYVEKFAWPFGLSAFYPVPEVGQALGLSYVVALAGLIVALGGLLWLAIQGRGRLLRFGALFFLVALLPSSRLIPVGMRFLAADRFFYLPGIGLFLILAYVLCRTFEARPAVRFGAAGLAAVLCLAWAGATWQRTQVWRNDETLWRDTLEKTPDSAYVLGGLAQALVLKDPVAAGQYADQALSISDRDGQVMMIKAFQHQRAGEYDACLDWLAKAEARNVNPGHIARMVGSTFALKGEPEKAIEGYSRALTFEPQATECLGWLALAWLALGDESAADECLRKMRKIDVDLSRLDVFLAASVPAYAGLTSTQQAMCLSPELMRYQYELAQNSQFVLNDYARAKQEYGLLLDLYPAVVEVWQAVAAQLPERRWPPQVFDVREHHVRKLAVACYNQACLLAGDGAADAALASLGKAFRYDDALRADARTDADLAGLRGWPDFPETTRHSEPPGSNADLGPRADIHDARLR